MNTKNIQIACPNCRSTIIFSINGNTFDAPLVCQTCKRAFSPHFYCPDTDSPARHIFSASKLYIDNAGKMYAFCPDHTFTTYALAADSKPRPRRTPVHHFTHFLDSLAFRMGLAVEDWRWRLTSRR